MTADECEFYRAITQRICGALDIGEAMHDTYCFLREHVPVEEVSYTAFDPRTRAIRFVAKADAARRRRLAAQNAAAEKDDGPPLLLDAVVAAHIEKTLERCEGQVEGKEGAAALLGVKPNTLRARMKKLASTSG